MASFLGPRSVFALAIAAAVAVAAFLLTDSLQAAIVVLLGAAAAVMVAVGPGDDDAAAQPAPGPSSDGPAVAEVLQAMIEPVLLVTDSRVTAANRAARALLGEHILGEDVRVAIRHPAAAERLLEPHEPGGAPIHLVGLGVRDQRWELHVTAIAPRQSVVQLVDRTGSYAAERMRVDFVANASHELRTPLASLLGFVETLREGAGDDPKTRDRFLKVMQDEARRMQRLVDDLISLSRIEAEKYRAPDQAVELGALAREVCRDLVADDPARGADLELSEAEVPPVVGDQAQLSQLLHNVIGNAMKYGRTQTPVSIRLAPQGDMVSVSVRDHGEGIPAEHLPRLTERFYRVDSGRSRAAGGTGLGLAIVKHIVERHRGRLDISSRVGEGTTVTVLLPRAPGAPGAPGAAVIKT